MNYRHQSKHKFRPQPKPLMSSEERAKRFTWEPGDLRVFTEEEYQKYCKQNPVRNYESD